MFSEQFMYTDLEYGKGFNPKIIGYQIKACSDGLSPENRDLLSGICKHYGEAVYRHAPRTAGAEEIDWRNRGGNSTIGMPSDLLDKFPVVLSYDQVSKDLYALTQVRYTGWTHDGRTGNFLAHALIFSPEDLKVYNFNPLAFSRFAPFQSGSDSDDTRPKALNLTAPVSDKTIYQMLQEAPYSKYLAAMISALCEVALETRPVMVCLEDWRQATRFAEALLGCLPPTVRCRTTLCTHESNRSKAPPHHLLMLCDENDRSFNLRPDEINSKYAIFDFVGDRFSKLGEPSAFAVFAAKCVVNQKIWQLDQYFILIEQLGYGRERNAWNELLPVTKALGKPPHPAILRGAVQPLCAHAINPHQAQIALRLLYPHIEAMAQANDHVGLAISCSELATLADRTLIDPGRIPSEGFLAQVQKLAGESLSKGQVRFADALLGACGKKKDSILVRLFDGILKKPPGEIPTPTDAVEQEKLMELLLDGLVLVEKTPKFASLFTPILEATFHTAQRIGQISEVWMGIGGEYVRQYLSGEWNADKENLTHKLITYMSASSCPDGNAWLNLQLLRTTNARGEELLDILIKCVVACSQKTEATQETLTLLNITRERLPDDEQHVVALGRMAEAAHSTPSGRKLFRVYQDAVKLLASLRQFKIRRSLAEADVVHVLSRELLVEVLPWSRVDSPRKLQSWQDEVLSRHIMVVDGLHQQVADLLGQPGDVQGILPLVEELLPKKVVKSASRPGLRALYSAVALVLPLKPDSWRSSFASLLEYLTPAAIARLRIMKFMQDIEQRASKAKWSTTEFPYTDTIWSRDVRSLENINEKRQVLSWCINTFETAEMTTLEEAQGLVRLLDEAGERAEVANTVERLLRGRDLVRRVLVVMAFTLYGLEEDQKKHQTSWGAIVGDILKRCDRETRRHFKEHLIWRFDRRGKDYQERLRQLCKAADLSLPERDEPPSSMSPIPPVKDMERPKSVSSDVSKRRGPMGIQTFVKQVGQWLGGSDGVEESPDYREKKEVRDSKKRRGQRGRKKRG